MFAFTLAILLLSGCGGEAEQQGEVTGVKAKAALEEVQSGNIKNLKYTGAIVVLFPDDEEVTIDCPNEFMSDIMKGTVDAGQFTFTIDDIVLDNLTGRFIATITIDPEGHQNVSLVQNEAGEWEVTRVID